MSEIVAYHESGHAYWAIRSGAEVDSVTIEPDRDDGPERFGDAQIRWNASRFSPQDLAERYVQVSLAGPTAEMIYSGEPFHPGVVAEWANDWEIAWKSAESIVGDPEKRLRYLEETTRQLYHRFGQDRDWAAIAEIADLLLAHETIEGAEVVEVVSIWTG